MYKKQNGITLVALVVTIIILLILAGVTINRVFSEGGIIDQTKKARFTYTIRALEEAATVQDTGRLFDENTKRKDVIPNNGELTTQEKDEITKNVPTLAESVYLATSETIYDRNMYWFKKDGILSEETNKEYLIDMDTLQVYQYEGTYFFKKIWHTLDVGVEEDKGGTGGETIPDGYMRIHLYYPEDSIDRQWRLGRAGESRTDGSLVWQDYTGEAILVKIDDIPNIWIRYNLKGVEVVQAPKGQLAVDITATPTTANVEKVTVSVYYDPDSTNRKVKIGNGGWKLYTGPFEITENCTIQAMAEKTIDVTDSSGNKLGTTKLKGKDSLTITNIGEVEKDETLVPPTITEVATISTEKARAKVEYPTDIGDIKKVYKLNNGIEQEYTGEIAIEEWGTELKAYYYKDEKRSPEATKVFNDPTKLEVDIIVQPNPATDESIKSTTVEIEYSEEAETKTYKIDNGQEQNYVGPFTVTQDCTITAYARKTGIDDATATETIKFKKKKEEQQKITAPTFSQQNSDDYTKATITIKYDSKAVTNQYSINGGDLQNYTGTIEAIDGDIIYAINTDSEGNSADATYTVKIEKPMINAPTFTQADSSDKTYATITIKYDDTKAVSKQYSINGGELKTYTNSIQAVDGDIIYAINTDKFGQTADATYTVKIKQNDDKDDSNNPNGSNNTTGSNNTDNPGGSNNTVDPENPEEELQAPIINISYSSDKQKGTITIKYDSKATTKQYSIDGGSLGNYTSSFEVTENGTVIYAINSDDKGNSKDATYTVTGLVKKLDVAITATPTTSNASEVTVSIDYDTRATTKTYTINGGQKQNYTGSFKITENCTIIAEATAQDAYGKDTKQITNLSSGLAAPVITETKTTETGGEVANITITYDKNSISNTYTINNGTRQNYTTGFQIRENDTIITAYSVDSKGNTAVSQYVVDDLVRYLLIEKDKYYWIKLPYPEQAINKEYKYKSDGTWKEYKEDGFILVKSEYENELIQGGKIVKLEVETGKYVDFDGHWYIFDGDPQKLQEDIYMRWDDPDDGTTAKIPLQIIAMPEPPETTDEVDIFIVYPPTATAKQYKIDDGSWQNYTGQLNITKNNTTVTARTQYSDGSWSEEVSYTITNIDETVAPEGIIEITADKTEWTNTDVIITITYNPNSDVLKKKYKVGSGSWQYTSNNTVTLTISENTTIYAALENDAGESSDAETYNVENIDKEGPTIKINSNLTVTTNSITISVTSSDAGCGISDTPVYSFYIKKSTDSEYPTTPVTTITATSPSTATSYTYEGLEEGISYNVKVTAVDKLGNLGKGMKTKIVTFSATLTTNYTWAQNKTIVTGTPKSGSGATVKLEVGETFAYDAGVTDGYTEGWGVLGAGATGTSEVGKLLIMTTSDVTTLRLDGKTGDGTSYSPAGYNNGISYLNTLCVNKCGTGARSVNVDDINRVTGYDPENQGDGTVFEAGEWYEYGNVVTYTASKTTSTKVTTPDTDGLENSVYYHPNGKQIGGSGGTKVSSITETSTYYCYYPYSLTKDSEITGTCKGISTNSAAYEMIFGTYVNTSAGTGYKYWLASSCVRTYSFASTFNMRWVNCNGCVDCKTILYSDSKISGGISMAVRAVVSL